MEIVTMARVVLNRVGSASQRGVFAYKEVSVTREVPDSSSESLLELVKVVAEENGELRDRLLGLAQLGESWRDSPPLRGVVFDVNMPNVQHSSPYAVAVTFPALKVDGRYYKLEEVKV